MNVLDAAFPDSPTQAKRLARKSKITAYHKRDGFGQISGRAPVAKVSKENMRSVSETWAMTHLPALTGGSLAKHPPRSGRNQRGRHY